MRARLRPALVHTLAALLRPLAQQAPPAEVRRVLIIKPDHLGDVLLLSPALQVLRAARPEAQLVALVGPWGMPVARAIPALDQVLSWPFPGFSRGAEGGLLKNYVELLRLGALLRAGNFDSAIIARDDHWWGGLAALAAGIPRRVGFAHPLVAPTLTAALPWEPHAHVSAQGLQLAAALLGQQQADAPLQFEPTADERRWAAGWLAERGLAGVPVVAIHPGTGGPSKLWPAEHWAQVADALSAAHPILLTGSPGEQPIVDAVAAAMRATPQTMVGEASVGGLAALLGSCALVLGVDSGPLHLAVSQRAPTVHLYGPGDERRFGPWGAPQRQVVLRTDLWCSPCGVFTHCPRGTQPAECMAQIAPELVIATAQTLLRGAQRGGATG